MSKLRGYRGTVSMTSPLFFEVLEREPTTDMPAEFTVTSTLSALLPRRMRIETTLSSPDGRAPQFGMTGVYDGTALWLVTEPIPGLTPSRTVKLITRTEAPKAEPFDFRYNLDGTGLSSGEGRRRHRPGAARRVQLRGAR
ncbi:MAG: hypothetical protein AAFU79_14145, partial [Myxococcota bacterium]